MISKGKVLIKLLRPKQWLKNIFVFTGVIFGETRDLETFFLALTAAFSFALISSSMYIFNDILDREQDKKHPLKRFRPLALGVVTLQEASILMGILFFLSFIVGFFVSEPHLFFLTLYFLINILYSLFLKHVVIIDVFCIASGFMLRILSGTTGIGIPPSKWLLLCGMMITLFLGFTKRKAEILQLKDRKKEHRKVLIFYDLGFLDTLIGITASAAIIAYSLYTMNEETIRVHHTENLIATIPFVVFPLFRYLYLIHKEGTGDPTTDLLSDKQIIISVILWAILTLALMH